MESEIICIRVRILSIYSRQFVMRYKLVIVLVVLPLYLMRLLL